MSKKSAGIIAYSKKKGFLEVLLVHPAPSPYFKPGDNGWWSIPKGEFDDEDALSAGLREFIEEVGVDLTFDEHIELTPVIQRSGKVVYAYAVEHEVDVTQFVSNTFTIEYPKGSGKYEEFPEVDKAEWFDAETAKKKLSRAQSAFIDELLKKLGIE